VSVVLVGNTFLREIRKHGKEWEEMVMNGRTEKE